MFHISCTHINVCYKNKTNHLFGHFYYTALQPKQKVNYLAKTRYLECVLASFTAILLCFSPPGNSKSFTWNCVQPFRCVLPGWCQREFQRAAPAQGCCSLNSRSLEVLWSTPWPSVAEMCLKLNGMLNDLIPWFYYYTKNLDCPSRYNKIECVSLRICLTLSRRWAHNNYVIQGMCDHVPHQTSSCQTQLLQ